MKRWKMLLLAGTLAAVSGGGALATEAAGAERYAYVGSYTSPERNGHGQGIEVFRIKAADEAWENIQTVQGFNPAFLAFDSEKRFLYAAHGDGDYVSAFAIDADTGRLTLLNQQPSGGKNGVHVAVAPDNRFLLVANNTAGNVSVLPIRKDGSLGMVTDTVSLPGTPGPHRKEQGSSHPHQVKFDPTGQFTVITDVGLDKVFMYRLSPEGKLTEHQPAAAATRPGAGPRHIDFHPVLPYAYVINGLDSTVAAYGFNRQAGTLQAFQLMPTIPDTWVGFNAASEIMVAPNGKYLYTANRIASFIGVYAIDAASGRLSVVQYVPSQGKTVRFFTVSPEGKHLYAANMDSDSIVVFSINSVSGRLAADGQVIATGSPACIIFK